MKDLWLVGIRILQLRNEDLYIYTLTNPVISKNGVDKRLPRPPICTFVVCYVQNKSIQNFHVKLDCGTLLILVDLDSSKNEIVLLKITRLQSFAIVNDPRRLN